MMDPEELDRLTSEIDNINNNPAYIAFADQQEADLQNLRTYGLYWAALGMLAEVREKPVAQMVAAANLRNFLLRLDEWQIAMLSAYLLNNTIHAIAQHEYGGDVVSAIDRLFGEYLPNMEVFVIANGSCCPVCGSENVDHHCPGLGAADEPVQG